MKTLVDAHPMILFQCVFPVFVLPNIPKTGYTTEKYDVFHQAISPESLIMTDSEHLFQLVGQKLELLQRLHACSGNQIQYVETEDMGAILEILAAKQRLLLEMEGLDRQIAVYHVEYPEERVWPTDEMREQCREKISQCDRLVREMLEYDQIAAERLAEKKSTAKQQLQQFVHTAHVQGVYQRQKTRSGLTARPGVDLGAG